LTNFVCRAHAAALGGSDWRFKLRLRQRRWCRQWLAFAHAVVGPRPTPGPTDWSDVLLPDTHVRGRADSAATALGPAGASLQRQLAAVMAALVRGNASRRRASLEDERRSARPSTHSERDVAIGAVADPEAARREATAAALVRHFMQPRRPAPPHPTPSSALRTVAHSNPIMPLQL
jgi:hypothetical protein